MDIPYEITDFDSTIRDPERTIKHIIVKKGIIMRNNIFNIIFDKNSGGVSSIVLNNDKDGKNNDGCGCYRIQFILNTAHTELLSG